MMDLNRNHLYPPTPRTLTKSKSTPLLRSEKTIYRTSKLTTLDKDSRRQRVISTTPETTHPHPHPHLHTNPPPRTHAKQNESLYLILSLPSTLTTGHPIPLSLTLKHFYPPKPSSNNTEAEKAEKEKEEVEKENESATPLLASTALLKKFTTTLLEIRNRSSQGLLGYSRSTQQIISIPSSSSSSSKGTGIGFGVGIDDDAPPLLSIDNNPPNPNLPSTVSPDEDEIVTPSSTSPDDAPPLLSLNEPLHLHTVYPAEKLTMPSKITVPFPAFPKTAKRKRDGGGGGGGGVPTHYLHVRATVEYLGKKFAAEWVDVPVSIIILRDESGEEGDVVPLFVREEERYRALRAAMERGGLLSPEEFFKEEDGGVVGLS
ncbi:hypothetical protein FKW77_005285 [Venturia effusa]|uniref:Uncharacterized protein n=1 Tax=Venturia effusa TaxID=50376 RepID=A0A517LIR3_9PEZI|nr:hypothetical protein FKW77_005285 [Venturia effusa]